ncbi:TlpA family protein disulfide reductase [Robertkochia marina]|uniref:TlpA family protein disulfide reductase n=1 Tax=Robertkochia marina TaxID=1227945 RepID=A0A4S3LZP1_9FLAO|nr:TlpA disulfide reductase family protein [Robertkochia marina]THD66641.1 TlpA family protein disulfide reductase [Robertkochia marina]TRZ45521.1 TlpA family protein disulfide reductase [Robertkochia marina]
MTQKIALIIFICTGFSAFAQRGVDQEMNFDKERARMQLAAEGRTMIDGNLISWEGAEVSTHEFRESYLVIDFWATWCGPCLKDAPNYKKLAEKYTDKNIRFISVSLDHDIETWREFLTKRKWTKDQYWYGKTDEDPFLSLAYSESSYKGMSMVLITIPKYVLISPTGEILMNSDLRPGDPEFEQEIMKYLQ